MPNTNVVSFAGANLPAVTSLATSLQALVKETSSGLGICIAKFDRTGCWSFGADHEEFESDDTEFAINPFSIVHGFIAWAPLGTNTVLGEVVVPMQTPLPDPGAVPANCPLGWQYQMGFGMQCITGDDKGTDMRFTQTAQGSIKAMKELFSKIATAIIADPTKPVAIVRLGTDSYIHKQYGKTFFPKFDIVRFISMDGGAAPAVAAHAAAAPATPDAEPAAPARRRRRPAAA